MLAAQYSWWDPENTISNRSFRLRTWTIETITSTAQTVSVAAANATEYKDMLYDKGDNLTDYTYNNTSTSRTDNVLRPTLSQFRFTGAAKILKQLRPTLESCFGNNAVKLGS